MRGNRISRWPSPFKRDVFCECGNEKPERAQACDRCIYLDGGFEKQALVIAALRGTDGLSVKELCEEIVGNTDESSRVAMLRTLKRMESDLRIRRYWRDADKFEIKTKRWGPMARISHGNSGGYWVYALDGMTQKQWKRAA